MEKQKTRDLIDDKYKWDLTTIYKIDEDCCVGSFAISEIKKCLYWKNLMFLNI